MCTALNSDVGSIIIENKFNKLGNEMNFKSCLFKFNIPEVFVLFAACKLFFLGLQ